MEIELLVVPGCSHGKAAEDLLRTALADVGLPSDFRVLTVTDAEDAARHGFAGLPTFRPQGRTFSLRLISPRDRTVASTEPGPRRADFPTCGICGKH